MAKLLLLGLCLLSFLGDAVPGFAQRNAQKAKLVVCNYCKLFQYGTCLGGMKSCSMEKKNGCRSQVFYKKVENGYEYSHSELDCFQDCKEKKTLNDEQPLWTLCCEENKCNLPYTYLKAG